MAAVKAELLLPSRISSEFRRASSALEKRSTTLRYSTGANLSRKVVAEVQNRGRPNQRDVRAGRQRRTSRSDRFSRFSREIHRAQGSSTRVVAHLCDKAANHLGLLDHE